MDQSRTMSLDSDDDRAELLRWIADHPSNAMIVLEDAKLVGATFRTADDTLYLSPDAFAMIGRYLEGLGVDVASRRRDATGRN